MCEQTTNLFPHARPSSSSSSSQHLGVLTSTGLANLKPRSMMLPEPVMSMKNLRNSFGMPRSRRSQTTYLALGLLLFFSITLLHIGGPRSFVPNWVQRILHPQHDPFATPDPITYIPQVDSADLRERLRALLRAPLPDYTNALVQNSSPDSCPLEQADRQAIADQLRQHTSYWKTISNAELMKKRFEMVHYLEKIVASGADVIGKPGGGRGIVMTGGNKDTTNRLIVTLRILRFEHHCTLPAEVFTFPGEIEDMHTILELKALGATVIELKGRQKLKKWKNFQIKADAIVASTFEEVLYLDSDNIPLRDPSYLFDADLYSGKNQPGAVFWPDITKDHPTNPIWRLMGKRCYFTDWQLETGQIVIKKSGNYGLNLAALHIAAHMQVEHPFFFKLSDGDKDTFRYGFWALQLPYSTAPWWLSTLGFHDDWDQGRYCGIAMVQHDISTFPTPHTKAGTVMTSPKPLFVHANLLKHRNRVNVPSVKSLTIGSPFTIIKRASNIDAAAPSLGAARMWVYGNEGSCLDVGVRQDILAEVLKNPMNSTMSRGRHIDDGQHVIEERFSEIHGAAFKDFDRMYRAQGGRDGGWDQTSET